MDPGSPIKFFEKDHQKFVFGKVYPTDEIDDEICYADSTKKITIFWLDNGECPNAT